MRENKKKKVRKSRLITKLDRIERKCNRILNLIYTFGPVDEKRERKVIEELNKAVLKLHKQSIIEGRRIDMILGDE